MSDFDKTTYIQAILAEDVYLDEKTGRHKHRDEEQQVITIKFPDGSPEITLRIVRDYDKSDGFQATIYQAIEKPKAFYGAIRGTEFDRELFQDGIKTDGGMGFFKRNAQLDETVGFTKDLLQEAIDYGKVEGEHPPIYLTGHSLAGTNVQYAKHYFGDRITRADAFNPYGAASLGWDQRVPNNPQAPDMYNHVMAGDVVSAASKHYGQVLTYATLREIQELSNTRVPYFGSMRDAGKLIDSHYIAKFTDLGEDGINVLNNRPQSMALAQNNQAVIEKYRDNVYNTRVGLTYSFNPFNLIDNMSAPFRSIPMEGMRADAAGISKYRADNAMILSPNTVEMIQDGTKQTLEIPKTQQVVEPKNSQNGTQPVSSSKQQEISISPQAQKLYQQCEKKLISLCHEKGITADSPQDFKNIAMALTAKGVESQMTKVDKMDFGQGDMLHILSYEPHLKMAAVAANEVANIPITESMAKIQQTEQQNIQLAQERQISQNQSQQRGMSL